MADTQIPQWTAYTYDQFTHWKKGTDPSDPYNIATVPLAVRDTASVQRPYAIVALNHPGGASTFVPTLQQYAEVRPSPTDPWPFPGLHTVPLAVHGLCGVLQRPARCPIGPVLTR